MPPVAGGATMPAASAGPPAAVGVLAGALPIGPMLAEGKGLACSTAGAAAVGLIETNPIWVPASAAGAGCWVKATKNATGWVSCSSGLVAMNHVVAPLGSTPTEMTTLSGSAAYGRKMALSTTCAGSNQKRRRRRGLSAAVAAAMAALSARCRRSGGPAAAIGRSCSPSWRPWRTGRPPGRAGGPGLRPAEVWRALQMFAWLINSQEGRYLSLAIG